MYWVIAFFAVLILFLISTYIDQRNKKGRGWLASSLIAIVVSSFAATFLVVGPLIFTILF
jgi:hypothetical protein